MNDKSPFKFIVIGGGTAGAIVSSYIKSYWGDKVEVVVVYNHAEPNIGVGESLTPLITKYLDRVGITPDELIKNCNATIKLGLKFKNWLDDGNYYYHPFYCIHASDLDNYSYEAAYQVVNNCYDNDVTYSNRLLDSHRVPLPLKDHPFSLHIDGVLTSKYILEKFKDRLTILDDIIIDVVKDDNEHIEYLVGTNNKKIYGDFFIDATGFKKLIFSKLNNRWVDKKDWLPLNRCIPNQVKCAHEKIPVCTTSEATDNGWVLQVPLRNKWGIGYLFSSDFTSNEEGLEKFNIFLNKTFNTDLQSDRIISFESGYWYDQWIGNSMCVGLSSGFTEPLEATNIHHVIYQMEDFTDRFNFKVFDFDINNYNETMRKFYDRVYLFLRFCYHTNRTDSPFWRYLTYNTPREVIELSSKISEDFLNIDSMPYSIFNYDNFFKIAYGLKKINLESYSRILEDRYVMEISKDNTLTLKEIKDKMYEEAQDHKEFLGMIS